MGGLGARGGRAVAAAMTTPRRGGGEGVAVMVVDPAVSWSELAAVVYGLVLEGRETESGRGPTDLFALADSLAEATGGAVTIEDRLSRVLAYSSCSSTPTRPGWRRSWAGRRRSGCASSSTPGSFRAPGGLRRSAVRRPDATTA